MKKLNLILLFTTFFITINSCKKNEPKPEETTVPILTTSAVINITQTTATSGGDITDDGGAVITECGVCYGTLHTPTIADIHTTDGINSVGTFTSNITGLQPNTTYYIRAYATNTNGTAYGNEEQFTSLINTTPPTVTTAIISNITQTTATSGGDITDDGGSAITESGVCFSTSPNPTIADNHTTDGIISVGQFTSNITGLLSGTTYHVRAFATNSNGTAYGNELQFTTTSNTFPGQTVLVNGGTFIMGSPNNMGSNNEHPQHSVTLSSFRISKYEITNQQYADFLNAINANADGSVGGVTYMNIYQWSQITYNGNSFEVNSGKENYPVVEVSWYGAKAYSEHYGGRLPTEAEWEFAASGGNISNGYTYSGSNNVDAVAWYSNGSGGTTSHPVGTKNSNELGLYDMSGNAGEWVHDWRDNNYYSISPTNDPQGPSTGTYRVIRGGHFASHPSYCTNTVRSGGEPINSWVFIGFRPVFAQ